MGVSLIITTYGRAAQLDRSLRRLAELTPPDEVVVVDDGTETRAVHGVCENLSDRLNIRYFYNNRPGWNNPCQPRNFAIKTASHGEIIISEPEVLFLTDIVEQFKAARVTMPRAILTELFCLHEPHENATLEECNEVPAFYVNGFRKEWMLEVGGFDEQIPAAWSFDDIDCWGRLDRMGHPRHPVYDARVRHLWHPSRISGEDAKENEDYLATKEYPRDVVANSDREWGVLVT